MPDLHVPDPLKPDPAKPDPKKPEISYPCLWKYRLIGRQALDVRAAVATIIDREVYELRDSNTSSNGKYHSFELSLTVRDEAERVGLFTRLAEHIDILFVL